jgi:hypothetical protein
MVISGNGNAKDVRLVRVYVIVIVLVSVTDVGVGKVEALSLSLSLGHAMVGVVSSHEFDGRPTATSAIPTTNPTFPILNMQMPHCLFLLPSFVQGLGTVTADCADVVTFL